MAARRATLAMTHVERDPLLSSADRRSGARWLKRAFDGFAATAGLLALGPVIAALSALIAFTLGRPVLFRQLRPGFRGRPFVLYKFRTMSEARDETGQLLSDSERLSGFGRFLRRTSLDELPSLWNVVRGELSLVGPRPLLMEYLERYSREQARRHDVPPGITGWAQVNGRNTLSWNEKLALDVWYVDHWSLGLDFRILARTIRIVFRGEGVSHPNQATMPRFTGSTQEGRDD